MNAAKTAVSGFAAGAAAMYFSDPDRGKRRRALLRDQSVRIWHDFSRFLDKAERDAVNRARGARCAIQAIFRDSQVDDQILVERVRSHLGRFTSHPHAIDVTAQDGVILLKGDVLQSEFAGIVNAISSVPGVKRVDQQLRMHQSSENIPHLEGGRRREHRSELMQQNWTPALRIAASALGGTLIFYAARKNGPLALAGALAGSALLGRAASNREFGDLLGFGESARAIELDKAIHIHAPVEEVCRYLSDYEKLPAFMTHLKEVQSLGNGRSHWVTQGRGGLSVSWDAEVIESVPNKLLAWRSLPGSKVDMEGVIRFDPDPGGGTRLSIRVWYKPPGGVLGHYVAALFGANPKSELNDDMVRLKSLIEVGKTRAHGVRVNRASLGQA